MSKVICPDNVREDIEVGDLLTKVMEKKKNGMRLSQACAAYANDHLELSYSFADDETYEFVTLRLVVERDTEIPSITEIIPAAVFYENEMKEMFGVKIQMIETDYQNKLYRIEAETPLLPKDKEEK